MSLALDVSLSSINMYSMYFSFLLCPHAYMEVSEKESGVNGGMDPPALFLWHLVSLLLFLNVEAQGQGKQLEQK